jgi:hypothetical protein
MEPGMSEPTPTFAIVGAVNHGKSSVVSTLSENDQVRISAMPGETVQCQRFELRDLFVFYDTPGFQNAIEALAELAPAAQAREPLALFREFIARHRADPAFTAETVLFQPVVDGAGIVYVVDGSEPLLEIHAAEMEILRLTGQPRLAIINRTSSDDHVADWKRRLGLHFNAVREFNAHHATFADRLELLETLAGIEQSWKPKLTRAVAIFREEWDKRLGECAEIIVELLADALTHREVAGADADSKARREAVGEELKARFIKAVTARETRAHKAIIKLFGHNRVRTETASEQLFDAGLFSDDTWRAFGLDEKQLVAAGAIGGAAAGAIFDLATVGHSIGIPTAVGTVTGALTGFVVGKRRPELKIKTPWLPGGLRLGGSALSVGPYTAINFPWILVDRALGTFAYVINRAHARRDEAVIQSARMQSAMDGSGLTSARWDEAHRKQCEQLFALIRRGKMHREQRETLRALFRQRLAEISAVRLTVE